MRRSVLAVLVGLLLAPLVGRAEIWTRTRPDGTVEFTNSKPAGGGWRKERSGGGGGEAGGAAREKPAAASRELALGSSVTASSSTFWAREREGGVVEFTNVPPIGTQWKVWMKTGPGKAASVRGRTDVVPARDVSSERFLRYEGHIRDQMAFYGIPEALVRAVIKTESDFDPNVVSSAGARGLMQLMPETARSMGVTEIFDPRQNIMGGCRYLQTLARRFCKTPAAHGSGAETVCSRDEVVRVIAGYHAGPGAVERYRGMPPYETTRAYVSNVLRRFDQYQKRPAPGPTGAVAER